MKIIKYVAVGLLVIGVGYVGYYLISPLFISIQLDEAMPVVVADTVEPSAVINETNVPQPDTQIIEAGVPVVGSPGHRASGTARLLTTQEGRVVRYENFSTINGPDLFVYLATDVQATEFVDLGRLKATDGNINYAIPDDVDLDKYPYVLVWCKQFGVLFNHAKIN
jgi:hypothetical protein